MHVHPPAVVQCSGPRDSGALFGWSSEPLCEHGWICALSVQDQLWQLQSVGCPKAVWTAWALAHDITSCQDFSLVQELCRSSRSQALALAVGKLQADWPSAESVGRRLDWSTTDRLADQPPPSSRHGGNQNKNGAAVVYSQGFQEAAGDLKLNIRSLQVLTAPPVKRGLAIFASVQPAMRGRCV